MFTNNELEKYIPIVLCAGFGTRLRPLSHFYPKVVCPLLNKPIAFRNIEQFFQIGFKNVYCNTHHLAEEVKNELIQAAIEHNYDPKRIIFWHEEEILETGGGITRIYKELTKQSKNNAKKDVIAISGDIIANFPISELILKWENKADDEFALMYTTEMIEKRKDSTWVSEDLKHIFGFGEFPSSNKKLVSRIFSNHQIISHKVFENLKVEKKSSIEMFYKYILNLNKKILHECYPKNNYWFNIGTPNEYNSCIKFFCQLEKFKNSQFGPINQAYTIPSELKTKIIDFILDKKDSSFNDKLYIDPIIISFKEKLGFKHEELFIPLISLENTHNTENKFLLYFEKED